MSKKKLDTQASRSEQRGPPGPSPLVIIAGLPNATALPAAYSINKSSRWRAVSVAFPNRDNGFYSDSAASLELGRLACEFAMSGARDANGVPKPSRIVVAFVADPTAEQLWDVFGHAVWPLPLNHPDWRWPKGRHWRHEIEVVNRVLEEALASAEAEPVDAIRRRLEARRSHDILLLPGRNFQIDTDNLLFDRFRAFMAGHISINDIEVGIRVERFAYERLSEFYNRMGGRGKRFAVDRRDIVFAKSNYGQDGGDRTINRNTKITASLVQYNLESRYRFGTPLEPSGFQHDAQRENGGRLDREYFYCINKGSVYLSGDHVNVFPSDVVTGQISYDK